MMKNILHTYGLNLWYAEALVKDVTPEQLCQQPHGLVNHPAWNLGHLVLSAHQLCQLLGVESSIPAGWDEKFKAGTPPTSDAKAYPSKDALLEQHRTFHTRVSEALPRVTQAKLDEPHPVEEMRQYFPTVGAQAIFMVTGHEMDHLGQMAAWRRAMGLPPAM